MTHRDRAGDPSGQRAGRREAAGDAGHRQGFPTPSGGSPARPEAVAQGFRPGARGVAMRHIGSRARRSPKALGNRLYGSLSTLLGIIYAPSTIDDGRTACGEVAEWLKALPC